MEQWISEPAVSGVIVTDPSSSLLLAVAAHLTRYQGQSRVHVESDLRSHLRPAADTKGSVSSTESRALETGLERRHLPWTLLRGTPLVAQRPVVIATVDVAN